MIYFLLELKGLCATIKTKIAKIIMHTKKTNFFSLVVASYEWMTLLRQLYPKDFYAQIYADDVCKRIQIAFRIIER